MRWNSVNSYPFRVIPYHMPNMFASITNNREHVLHELLPPQSVASQNYNLRPRKHHFELPNKTIVISQTAILCSACYFSKPTDVPFSGVIFILFISHPHILLNIVLSAF